MNNYTPDFYPGLDPRSRVRAHDVDDVVASVTDHDADLLDVQETLVVIRNQHGTRVLLRQDALTGAYELICKPRDGEEYELLVGPDVPFSALTTMIKEA
jgi:hypothetical protein